ncbi:cellulase family glycosylhydrolase [Flagellatimonas centrodinii]|uniref:cellulase family glycosylhydrolase n=1 Tax=Flagellatimonas centrodinii TaxID=2806210 RepID=UPI001FEF700A|nr:cellulase family glycosylhydrolase [Flagellatimonas centrodinii]ULQ46729.1 cellulase family glycosylhydrolase [Flagellatimonas centrodinii]
MFSLRFPCLVALSALLVGLTAGCSDDAAVPPPDGIALGGRISGLNDAGLVLARGAERLAIAPGQTKFSATPLPPGTLYQITVSQQPEGQRCSIFRGSGRIPETATVTDIRIVCASCRDGLPPVHEVPMVRAETSGGRLYLADVCDERLQLRGVNDQFIERYGPAFDLFTDDNLMAVTGGQRRAGANAIRIVWYPDGGPRDPDADGDRIGDVFGGSVAALDRRIQSVVDHGMVPILDIHDYTGADLTGADDDTDDPSDPLNRTVRWLLREDVRALLDRHAAYLLLNLLNEAGTCYLQTPEDSDPFFNNCTEAERFRFRDAYRDALSQLRAAGLRLPVIIDAPDFGQSLEVLRRVGPALMAGDDIDADTAGAQPNLMFSAHPYWYRYPPGLVDGSDGFDAAELRAHRDELRCAVGLPREGGLPCGFAANLALLLGEVASTQDGAEGESLPLPYRNILETAVDLDLDYLFWTWFNDFDADRTLTRVVQSPAGDCLPVTPPERNNCGLFRDGLPDFDGTDLTAFGRDAVFGLPDDALPGAPAADYRMATAPRSFSMIARDRYQLDTVP